MSSTPKPSRWSSRNILSYALAFLLPPLGSWLTARVPSLHAIPFSLHFIALVVIAMLGGLYPALLGFVVGVVTRGYFTHLGSPDFHSQTYDITRVLVILSAILIISFITQRRHQAELKLKAALTDLQDRTADLVASLSGSNCACWTIDLDSGRSARWFQGSYPVFGRPFSELEALPSLIPLIYPDDQPGLITLIETMKSTADSAVFEFRTLWPSGEIHTLEMRGTRVSQKPCVWRGVTVDITDRKLAEAALLRSEKLAAMGRLASTVAHEINNPLEAVTNLLYLASADTTLTFVTRNYLSNAERELARLSNITRLTLGFVRTSGNIGNTDLALILDEVFSIFQHRLDAKNIQLQRHYAPAIAVHIVPHEFRQIATNLIANAIDAVPESGARIDLHLCREACNAIVLLDDNGSGIAPAQLPRIFEPFFTTKQEVGTGIGLWVTRELVEKNGGHISVHTTDLPPGIVTRFRLEFPLAEPDVS